MRLPIEIDEDIRRARTLPSEVYLSSEAFDLQASGLFPRTWQLVSNAHEVSAPGRAAPWTLPGDPAGEPLLAVRDDGGRLRVLSNVCTHRGALIVEAPCPVRGLRCPYHGRRFDLDGRFRSMPAFDEVPDFPSPADDLAGVPSAGWGPLAFAGIEPTLSFEKWIEPAEERLGWLPWKRVVFDPGTSRDYEVHANWAAYCDNYLEGFHIPYVHPDLATGLDYPGYRTETFEAGSLQVALAAEGEPTFDLPASHPDHGRPVAAYYLFLFPNTMLNAYPWGLSVNQVLPRGPGRTTVRFLSYVLDASRRERGAGAALHQVEMEDERVVESVHRGLGSRFYDRGRYSPSQEVGVHHFHRLLARHLNEAAGA